MKLHKSEELQYATVRIESTKIDKTIMVGTGYLYNFKPFKLLDELTPMIITNKHVIQDSVSIKLVFTLSNDVGEPYEETHMDFNLNASEIITYSHPDNNIDLCAINIKSILEKVKSGEVRLYFIPLDSSIIPSQNQIDEFGALEDIILIGCPNGIWDITNNKPIIRKGITATHFKFNYNGKREFLIDAAIFGGSSGSPVFLYNENGIQNRDGSLTLGSKRLLLLGTLYAYHYVNLSGQILVEDIPITQSVHSITAIPINLGLVIKSDLIFELEEIIQLMMKSS